MTDRLKGFVVTLDHDTREDDARAISDSIKMIRGVGGVSPLKLDPGDYVNREMIRAEMTRKLWAALNSEG